MSCDESVLRHTGRDIRAEYSSSLLRLSTGKRLPVGPLAFGAGDLESRIENVLNFKKPTLWVAILALIVVFVAGITLATGRAVAFEELDSPFGHYYQVVEIVYENPHLTEAASNRQEETALSGTAPQYFLSSAKELYELDDSETNGWHSIGVLEEIRLDKWSFLRYVKNGDGWTGGQSLVEELHQDNYSVWQFVVEIKGSAFKTLPPNGLFHCLLQQKDGTLYLASGWYEPDRKHWPGIEDSYVSKLVRLEEGDNVVRSSPIPDRTE